MNLVFEFSNFKAAELRHNNQANVTFPGWFNYNYNQKGNYFDLWSQILVIL